MLGQVPVSRAPGNLGNGTYMSGLRVNQDLRSRPRDTLTIEMHCCVKMTESLKGETAIVFVPKFREYGISVFDGGSSFVAIRFCPWCATPLPASLRDEWFNALEKLGLDANSEDIPREFLTEAWWRKEAGI